MASRRPPVVAKEEYIRVRGDLVEIIEETVTRRVSVTDWYNHIHDTSLVSPVLPIGCRYYGQTRQKYTMIIVEQSPMVRRVKLRNSDAAASSDTGAVTTRLAFPYVNFVLKLTEAGAISQVHVYYRNSPITSMDDQLYKPCLWNCYEDGRVCNGEVSVQVGTINDVVNAYTGIFWDSPFRDDLTMAFRAYYRNPKFVSIDTWAAATQENPLFPLGIDWQPIKTVREVVAR